MTMLDNSLLLDYKGKQEISQAYIEWLADAASWMSFITLTYRDSVHPDLAMKHLKRLVHRLNEKMYYKRYRRRVGHSYFSYVVGVEYQKRDVLHFHMLVDQYVDFDFIHSYWGNAHGFVRIDPVVTREGVLRYITKYVFKDGTIVPFIRETELIKNNLHRGSEFVSGLTQL